MADLAERIAYVHIGRHKSGTKAIQSALTAGRTAALSHGFLYPLDTDHHHAASRAFNDRYMQTLKPADQESLVEKANALGKAIAESKAKVIVSSEGFQDADPDRVR